MDENPADSTYQELLGEFRHVFGLKHTELVRMSSKTESHPDDFALGFYLSCYDEKAFRTLRETEHRFAVIAHRADFVALAKKILEHLGE